MALLLLLSLSLSRCVKGPLGDTRLKEARDAVVAAAAAAADDQVNLSRESERWGKVNGDSRGGILWGRHEFFLIHDF